MFKKSLLVAVTLTALANFAQAGEVLDRIKKTQTINTGFRENSLPYSLITNGGTPRGYSLDVCKEIIREIEANIGKSLSVNSMAVTAANRAFHLKSGNIDLECGSTTRTPDKIPFANFAILDADPISMAVQANNNSITKLDDIKGKKVAVVSGTTGEQLIRKLNASNDYDVDVVLAKDYPQALLMLSQGRVDFVSTNSVLLNGEIAKLADKAKYKVLNVRMAEPGVIGIMYPNHDPELTAIVKGAMSKMKADGRLDRLHNKWFNEPLHNGINLKMTWTRELRDIVWSEK